MPTITSDYRIDSVLAGADLKWNATGGSTIPVVTYSFMAALPSYASTQDANGFSVFTAEQRSAAREILAGIQAEFNISFSEVTESTSDPARYGAIRFGNNTQNATSGYASYPDASMGDAAADVYINNAPSLGQTTGVVKGSNAYSTLIHEIGHALGLKHPGNYNAADNPDPASAAQEGPFLPTAEDSELYSIMSYTTQPQGLERINWAPYDIAALTYLYGHKPENTGDDAYTLSDAAGQIVQTLIDDGGTDTLDASGLTVGITLDLRPAAPGTLSSVGKTGAGEPAANNLSFSLNTVIERAVGTGFDDQLTGNSADNTLTGGAGNDRIDGGAGSDTAIFGSNLSNYVLSHSGSTYTVRAKTGADGTDTLTNVESLKFADLSVNLGVQAKAASAPSASVQKIMELYVAFFNRMPDADGLSYWVDQFKAGTSINSISESFYNIGASADFASRTGFSASMTNQDFINVFYKNVLGRADGADAGGLAYWNGKLADGSSTRWSLAQDILNSAHTFKGDATWGHVADLLDNKYLVAKTISLDLGLTYNNDPYTHGVDIAKAVTSTDTTAAIALVGISAADIGIG